MDFLKNWSDLLSVLGRLAQASNFIKTVQQGRSGKLTRLPLLVNQTLVALKFMSFLDPCLIDC